MKGVGAKSDHTHLNVTPEHIFLTNLTEFKDWYSNVAYISAHDLHNFFRYLENVRKTGQSEKRASVQSRLA